MIIYKNKEWWSALLNFYRSYVIRVLLRGVLAMGVVTAVICFLILVVFGSANHTQDVEQQLQFT